ncbi:MAG TPA: DUF4386 domain-containing protein, partial [Thermoanaerobaculia bacterium]
GLFARSFVDRRLIASGDAAATATNIAAHRGLLELGFVVYMIEMACNVAMTALYYQLLKPVSRTGSLLAAFFSLVGCVVKIFTRLFYIAPLLVLGGEGYLRAFRPDQSQALAQLFLEVNDHGAGMALAFFGFATILKGWLIIRSIFLPKFLGVLSIIAGVGWLTWLHPSLGYRTFAYVAPLGLLGAAAQILWLLVVGVNEERWKEQASASAASIWR